MHHLGGLDLAGLQILVVLQSVVAGRVVVVRWALVLREGGVSGTHAELVVDGVVEVEVREDAVVGHAVVGGSGLEIVQVRESGAIGVAQPEWHVLVSIVDGVALLTLEELENVVLDDWVLVDGTSVGTGGLAADAVADGEDILVSVVLQGVAVDIDLAGGIADARVEDELVLLAGWVDVGVGEVMLHGLTSVDVLEGGDVSAVLLADLEELPAEVDLDASLLALFEGDLVGVWESVDELVGCPVLNLGALGGHVDKLVLAEEGLIVQSVEVGSLTLVGDGGRVADVAAGHVVGSVVVVTGEAGLLVDLMDVDVVVLGAVIVVTETLDVVQGMIEASADHESLVGHLLTILKGDGVAIWVQLGDILLLDS